MQLYCPDSSLCSGYTPSYTTVSDRILIGYQTPYDVMNINVHTANSGTVTWQYWNGTSFASLTTASDTTNGLQNDGSVTFLPPSNWQPHVVNGSQPKYWVQATIGSGTVEPGPNLWRQPAGSERLRPRLGPSALRFRPHQCRDAG